MNRFTNILVGVDLANDGQFIGDKLSDATNAAIENGCWLAERCGARLVFFNVLEIPEYARFLAEEFGDIESTLIADSEDRLASLAQQARAENIDASYVVAFGKSWVEIIRQVLKQQHDLVITGTRQRGTAASVLLGSTGMKLLRKCPCPVWVTKPRLDQQCDSILVAHDLQPAGDLAMELGCSMAHLKNAQLHVIHAAEYPEIDYLFTASILAERKQEYRREAEEHITRQLASVDLPLPAQLHFAIGSPDIAIMNCIERHDIDLLVMGTVGRTGIAGVLMGNTAERLLPRINSSVLAVKPKDFVCPIAAE